MNIFKLMSGKYREEAGDEGAAGGGAGAGAESGSLLSGAGEAGAGEAGAAGGEAGAGGETTDWYVAEGVKGEGDKPDWYNANKYKSVEEQAKAYPALAAKFGAFTGAPEGDYELVMPEGYEGEFLTEDPLLIAFTNFAKESNMSQEGYTKMLHSYVENLGLDDGASKQAELAALGDNAPTRIDNIAKWGKANLDAEGFEGLLDATTTAKGFKAVEALIALTKTAKIPLGDNQRMSTVTKSELDAAVADPKYKSDPSFRKEVDAKFKAFYGEGSDKQVVG